MLCEMLGCGFFYFGLGPKKKKESCKTVTLNEMDGLYVNLKVKDMNSQKQNDERNMTEELYKQLMTDKPKMFSDMGVQTDEIWKGSCDCQVQVQVLEDTVNTLTAQLRKVCQDLSLGRAVHDGVNLLKAVPCSRHIHMSAVVNKTGEKKNLGGMLLSEQENSEVQQSIR